MAWMEQESPDSGGHGTDVGALAAAVVSRAVADVFYSRDGIPVSHKLDTPGVAGAEAREALVFLTSESGAWRRSREHWCLLAGIDPDAVRSFAMRHASRTGTGGRE